MIHARRALILLCCLFMVSPTIYAHDPGLSYAELNSDGRLLNVVLTYSKTDIETLLESVEDRGAIDRLMRDSIIIRLDGITVAPSRSSHRREQSNAVRFDLTFETRPGAKLSFESALIRRLPFGHKQFLTVATHGVLSEDAILTADGNRFETVVSSVQSRGSWSVFVNFLGLGIGHILLGFDHLAFLAALLLGGGGFRGTLKIVTAFTVAHSLTLAMSVFNVVNFPGSIVEPVIAGSIVYVALENLFNREVGNRWAPAFAFGLIHGFGFATVLREMGIGQTGAGVVVPLLSFNFGVEIGQLCLAAVATPAIIAIRNRPRLAGRLIPACSVLLTISGLVWLIQRLWT